MSAYEVAIGVPLHNIQIKPYWKIKEQMVGTCHILSNSESNANKVYEMLRFASILTKSVQGDWTFIGPEDNDELQFECIFNARYPDGSLSWAHLQFASQ